MKKIVPLLLVVALAAACKKDNTNSPGTPTVTSPEYIDKLLFVKSNDYMIQTSQPATFSSSDPNITMSSSGHITDFTSGEIVQITIKWNNTKYAPTTIYALGATDIDQIEPAAYFHGETATDPYDSYVQGWKLLETLPDPNNTYALVLRHADASFGRDWTTIHTGTPPANWWTSTDSLLARQLNTQGIQRATDLGTIMKDLKYPITRVFTSQFYRARHTADLMAMTPTYTIDSTINHLTHNNYAPGIFYGMVGIVNKQPIDNNMTLIVTHHPGNEPPATGFSSFPPVSTFNWSGSYFIHIDKDTVLTYAGGVTYAMFKYHRDLLVK